MKDSKKARKRYQGLSEKNKKKTKSKNMIANDIKICHQTKTQTS